MSCRHGLVVRGECYFCGEAVPEPPAEATLVCEYPGCGKLGTPQPAYTAYPWDGEGEDPNRDQVYCAEHAEEHRDHWQGMWQDYYASVM